MERRDPFIRGVLGRTSKFPLIRFWLGMLTLKVLIMFYCQLHHEALTLATHATPDDAVCIHSDVKSKASLGMHFATFAGSEDEVRGMPAADF